MVNELSAEKIRQVCDASFMECETTEGLVPLREIIGQERAVRALKFGIGIRDHGFNIYVAGWPGTGRTTAVKNFVEEIACSEPVRRHWFGTSNFLNEVFDSSGSARSRPTGDVYVEAVVSYADAELEGSDRSFLTDDFSKGHQSLRG